MIACFLAAARF